MPTGANGTDVVRTLVHGEDDLGDLLRRVLEVRIERDDIVAARLRKSGEDRHVLSGVTREHDDPGCIGPTLKLFP